MIPLHPPLILTVAIDSPGFNYFNRLRQQYFPPSRNFLEAHLTMFHALPNESAIIDTVKKNAAQQCVFELEVIAPVPIGRGVAYKLSSDVILELHKNFQEEWWHILGAQDRQKLWPHITIQNKVTASEAQQSLSDLTAAFAPFSIIATGLQLWEYLNGPWKLVDAFDFKK